MISGRSAATSLAKSHRPSDAPPIIRSTRSAAVRSMASVRAATARGVNERDSIRRSREGPAGPCSASSGGPTRGPGRRGSASRPARRRTWPGRAAPAPPRRAAAPARSPGPPRARAAPVPRPRSAAIAEPPQRRERRPGLVGDGVDERGGVHGRPSVRGQNAACPSGTSPVAGTRPVRLLARGHLPGVRAVDAGPQGARAGFASTVETRPLAEVNRARIESWPRRRGTVPARSRTPTARSTSSTCSSQGAAEPRWHSPRPSSIPGSSSSSTPPSRTTSTSTPTGGCCRSASRTTCCDAPAGRGTGRRQRGRRRGHVADAGAVGRRRRGRTRRDARARAGVRRRGVGGDARRKPLPT